MDNCKLYCYNFHFISVAFYEVALAGSPCYFELMTWIDSEMFSTSWGFMFDSLTVVMLVVVTCVSSLVHLYSTEYMEVIHTYLDLCLIYHYSLFYDYFSDC